MRRVILHMMMSLDGFVSSPDGSEDWMTAPDHDRDAASLAVANAVDAAIVGHGVYVDMSGYWPTARGDTDDQRDYIARVNQMPKLIVCHQPTQLEWNNASPFPVADDAQLADRICDLKSADGGDIVLWGGASLVQQFTALDLIDGYQLIVQPIALGAGASLFADTGAWRRLRLIEVESYESGAVMMTYRPDRRSNGH